MLDLPLVLAICWLCLLITGLCVQDVRRHLRAPRLGPGTAWPAEQPFISVLIPARNEAAGIGACLSGLAHQSYSAFEVIVVDDESSDGTAGAAGEYVGQLPALDVVPGVPLPAGWAGKCWACWQAAVRARGEWLLFLDADVRPAPALLGALAARARACRADLITLMPLLRMGSPAERLLLPAFQTILYSLYPLDHVSHPRAVLAFANGQCVFIRRSVYDAIGGHQAVRTSVLEDVDLGQRARAAGYRLEAALAPDLLEVRMYTDWPGIVEGLGKHAIAGYRSGGWRSAWVGVRQALIAFAAFYMMGGSVLLWMTHPGGILAASLLAAGAALAVLTLACSAWLVYHRYRISPWWGLCYPLGLALYFGIAGRALVQQRRGQGVVWKGRKLAGDGAGYQPANTRQCLPQNPGRRAK